MIWRSDLPSVPVDDTTISGAFAAAVQRYPDRIALIDGPSGASVTYAELDHRVGRISVWLRERSVGPGDRVAIICPNAPPVAAFLLATWRIGATALTLNPMATEHEISIQLDETGASVVVASPAVVPRLAGRSRQHMVLLGDSEDATSLSEVLATEGEAGVYDNEPDRLALLAYSSGTSGMPKAATLSHRNLVAVSRQIARSFAISEHDVTLALAPFFHILGMTAELLMPLTHGSTVVTTPRFDPSQFLHLLRRHRVSYLAVPPPVAMFLARDPAVEEHDLSGLRLLAIGGAPLPAGVENEIAKRLPACAVGQGWGLTETAGAISVPRAVVGSVPGTVGHLLPNTELRVCDPDTGAELSADQTGELWARGPQVMLGYLDEPDETAAILDPADWLRTGDLGHVTADGQIVIVDRLKELIKVNAYQVAPAEVEAALIAHPEITDAAVTSRPDTNKGQVPIAYVVASKDFDVRRLDDWLDNRLAPYKHPNEIRLAEELPRTPSGKLLRRLLPTH